MNQFETPILFLVFNRFNTAQRVFDEIRKQKPKYLYVAADGPRRSKIGEAEKCQKVRSLVDLIDWDCELKTLFRDENLGCGKAISSAITWFFQQVEQGIILEDDCVPHPDFFHYCEEMLNHYRDNETIKIISGDNFQDGQQRGSASYYFSAYPNIWGWATWRRTWEGYDLYLDQDTLLELKDALDFYFPSWNERQMWIDKFLTMKRQGVNTWDYQLLFKIWRDRGLCINPNVNLISNIGAGEDATHTNDSSSSMLNLIASSILPLKHATFIERDLAADKYYYENNLHKNIIRLLWRWIRRQFLKAKFVK